MAEGYVDEGGRIRRAEEHDVEELAVPPGREGESEGEQDEEDDEDEDDEDGEGDDD